jgi:hypothetical protein
MKKLISSLCLLILLSSCGQEADGGSEGTDGVGVSDHRIFVTSVSYTGAELGGISGADSACTTLAKSAELTRTYKAVISDSTTTAKRLNFTGGVYSIPSAGEAELIVASGSDLWDTDTKNLLTNINIDENGSSVSSYVWTGTDSDGATMTGEHCSDWNSTSGTGRRGHTDQSDDRWIEDTDLACTNSYPILCISQS